MDSGLLRLRRPVAATGLDAQPSLKQLAVQLRALASSHQQRIDVARGAANRSPRDASRMTERITV